MTFVLSSQETYQVKLSLFEGPLDLLLHLIEREELDITKISLAQVTDQYLAYISRLEELHPEILADFLVVAAKLLLIKSQVLLPRPEAQTLAVDEEDPGEALARQLREYKQFKTAAQYLRDRAASGARTFVRIAPPPELPRKVDLSDVTLDDLLAAWQEALLGQLEDETLPASATEPTITIDDKMALLRHRLAQKRGITFSSLLADTRSRLEVIVTFLALLQMFKTREIVLRQETLFDEIYIEAAPVSPSPVQPADTPAKESEAE
jgi:segregation and condensation protein A